MKRRVRHIPAGASAICAAIGCLIVGSVHMVFVGDAVAADSMWVKMGQNGRLVYLLDGRGDRIMDFSSVGYQGGTVPLPTYSDVVAPADIITVNPIAGDNLASIQAAINTVAAKPLNANGFRGVVQLTAGAYDISGTLSITSSGIILRGVGDAASGASSTILKSTSTADFTQGVAIIQVDSSNTRSTNTTHNIADKVVPVGATSFTLDSTSGYAIGDTIYITRPSPQTWIDDIHMDVLTNPWLPGSKNQSYERKITYIDTARNRVFFDAPLPNSFEKRYGTDSGFAGTVSKYTFNRTTNVGIENIRGDGMAAFIPGTTPTNGQDGPENHASSFVMIQDTADAWVRNITAQHFSYATVEVTGGARNVTVDDAVTIEPVGLVTGGRFYPYNIEGQFTLMKNLASSHGRHDFVNNSPSRGPNVFLDGVATNSHSNTGPHQRWSTGTLYDNIDTSNEIDVENRGNSGSGHGWGGANMVVWNSNARGSFEVQSPPTAQNWVIGTLGTNDPTGSEQPGYYDQTDTHDGVVQGQPITLGTHNSLYRAQLAERMAHLTEERREYWVGDFDNYVLDAGEVTPVDSAWLAAVQSANPGKAVNGMDASTSTSNVIVPFTLNFDIPNKPVRSAVLTLAIHGGGATPNDDQIFIESTSNAINVGTPPQFPLPPVIPPDPPDPNPDIPSQIVTLEFSASDIQKSLSFLADGKLNLMVSNDHTVDWADLIFTISNQSSAWTGATNNTWDINGTQNWNDGSVGTPYFDGDVVSFGDGPTNRSIFVSGSVSPGAITVNNSAGINYNFFGGAITGGTGILKQGAGTLTLSGSNTYTGATLIQGGVVSVSTLANGGVASNLGASSSAAGNLALDGGTLRWTGSADTSTDRLFTLGAGGGTLDSSPTTSSGLFFVNTGTMGLAGSGARTLTLTGTELDLTDMKGNTLSAALGDAAVGQPTSVVKNGNNYWILNGTSSYSGGTTINAGRLRPGQPTSFGTGQVNVADGAQAYLSLSGTLANDFSIAGNGITETIGGSPANLGALRLQSSPVLTGQITLTGNARITAHTSDGTLAGRITGGFALELGGGGSSGSLLTLSNPTNDWSGGLTISRGTVALGASNVIPHGVGKGNVTISAFSGTGNTSILDLNGSSQTINGLSSTGTNANAQINNSSATPATLTVGDNNQSSTFSGVIKNTGTGALSLTKIGSGTLTLAGTANANTYTGTTTVNQGTLQLNATHTLKKLKLEGASATVSLNTALSSARSFEVTAVGGAINHNGNAFGIIGGTGETVTWNSGAQLHVQGAAPGRVVLTIAAGTNVTVADNTASIVVHPGATLELTTAVSATSGGGNFVNIQNDSTTSFKVTGTNQQVGNVDGIGNTTITANNNLVAGRIVQNSLAIQGTAGSPNAALTVRRSGGNPQGLNSQVSVVNTLSLANDGAPITGPPPGGYTSPLRQYFGKLDLMNNDLVIRNGSPTLFAEVQDMIRAGASSGGTRGITSQEALSSGEYAGATWLGSLYNGIDDDNNPGTPDVPLLSSFDGVSLSGGEILLKYTWFGDADLSGIVDTTDAGLLTAGYFGDPGVATNPWVFGDFDYNGIIDTTDAGLLTAGYFGGGSSIELPEPSTLILAMLGALAVFANGIRQRKRGVSPRCCDRKPIADPRQSLR